MNRAAVDLQRLVYTARHVTRLARHCIGHTEPVRGRHAVRHDADTVPVRQGVRALLAVKCVH